MNMEMNMVEHGRTRQKHQVGHSWAQLGSVLCWHWSMSTSHGNWGCQLSAAAACLVAAWAIAWALAFGYLNLNDFCKFYSFCIFWYIFLHFFFNRVAVIVSAWSHSMCQDMLRCTKVRFPVYDEETEELHRHSLCIRLCSTCVRMFMQAGSEQGKLFQSVVQSCGQP